MNAAKAEVTGHFLERNDFRPFPEMIISVVNDFFARANQTLKTCVKTYINHFHGNHFWTPSKSFSCAINHFWTGSKWFFTAVNHFFFSKKQQEMIFCGSKSFNKNHFQMEIVSKKIISKWKSFTNKTKIWTRKSFRKGNNELLIISKVSCIGNHFRRIICSRWNISKCNY